MPMTNGEKSLEYTQNLNLFGQSTEQTLSNFELWKS